MSAPAWAQFVVLVVLVLATVPLLGGYMARVYATGPERERFRTAPLDRLFAPLERVVYRVTGVDPAAEQRWTVYALSLLAFSLVSVLVVYAFQRLQPFLPLNPDGLPSVPPALAFNTAVSFVTNTNWQNYAGESTMSHLVQMSALAVQNFTSAAVGMSVAMALVRGLTRRRSATVGNFWVDLTRGVVRVLLPIALVFAIVFVAAGMVQNLAGLTEVTTVEGSAQALPGGPVASQEAIKELGTNGGGFYNANAAHPFENPDGFTNLLQMWLILSIPFSLPYVFGRFAGNLSQGWAVWGAMFTLWAASALIAMPAEAGGNPVLADLGAVGGNMEGKEVRFGEEASGLYAATTTGTSTGSVNALHDSFTPIGGGVALFNIMLGEVSPGGAGAGLYGMLVFALLAVFLAGLMVGRTPEYLGKKVQATEMKLVVLYIIAVPIVVLGFTGASVLLEPALAARLNEGPHGLTEIAYAFTSAGNNNGSAFGGLSADTDWYNTTLGLSMLVGRFVLIVAVLALAGSLARKQTVPVSAGTFPTDGATFYALLVAVVLLVVGLTYFPLLSLGPIVEHLTLFSIGGAP